MRSLIPIVFFLFACMIINAKDNFELQPIHFDIKGVEAKGNIIAAYGNYGSVLISYDNAETWQQIQPSRIGNIINFFIEEDRMTAFTEDGRINLSYDNGESWENAGNIKDSVILCVMGKDNYYLRSRTKIIQISKDFENVHEAIVDEIDWDYDGNVMMHFRDYLTSFNDNVIAYSDSSLIKYDSKLNPIDTLIFFENISKRLLTSDDRGIYIYLNHKVYKISDFQNKELVFDNSEPNYKLFDSISPRSSYLKIKENKIYSLNLIHDDGNDDRFFHLYEILDQNSAKKIGTVECFLPPTDRPVFFNEFTVENDILTLVTKDRFLASNNLKDNKTTIVSDLNEINVRNDFKPDFINDSTFIYHTHHRMYKTEDNGITFQHVVGDSILFDDDHGDKENFKIKFKYFDEKDDILYIGGFSEFDPDNSATVKISDNYGKSYISKKMDSLSYAGTSKIAAIQKSDDFFMVANNSHGAKYYNRLYFYDKQSFEIEYWRLDSNYRINHVYAKDLDNYLMVSSDTNFMYSYTYVKYTTNRGKEWDTLNEYGYNYNSEDGYEISHLTGFNEIELSGIKYWLLFSYRWSDSTMKIDVLNLQTNKLDSVYTKKITDGREYIYAEVCTNKDTVYIAIDDTLYSTSDLYDVSKWKYQVLPNNGKIFGKFYKTSNSFYALYSDDIRPINFYRITPTDSTTSISESNINEYTYFYSFPPYPIPANNYVNSEIYWDPKYNIEKADISIYNIMGSKIEGKEHINIKKQSNWNGILTWNCGGVSDGTYFIVIKFGTTTKTISVLVGN